VSSRSIQIIGGDDRQHAHVDGIGNSLVAMDDAHYNIHRGIYFTASFADEALASSGSIDMLVTVISVIHAKYFAAVGAQSMAYLYPAATWTPETGTPLTPLNFNGLSSLVPDTTFEINPTVSATGALSSSEFIPGGSKGQLNGGSSYSPLEFILAPGDYLIRLTNKSTSTIIASVALDFYQPNLLT